jgi:hypothetical protein
VSDIVLDRLTFITYQDRTDANAPASSELVIKYARMVHGTVLHVAQQNETNTTPQRRTLPPSITFDWRDIEVPAIEKRLVGRYTFMLEGRLVSWRLGDDLPMPWYGDASGQGGGVLGVKWTFDELRAKEQRMKIARKEARRETQEREVERVEMERRLEMEREMEQEEMDMERE